MDQTKEAVSAKLTKMAGPGSWFELQVPAEIDMQMCVSMILDEAAKQGIRVEVENIAGVERRLMISQ